MSFQLLEIDKQRANPAKLVKAGCALATGGIAVVPTDTNYALACRLGDKAAIVRIHQLRRLDGKHTMTLLLPNFSSLGVYAVVDNVYFRLLKDMTPGPYTFILPATKEVPRACSHPKRKTIGIRIPDQAQLTDLINGAGGALLSTTLKDPASDEAITDLAPVQGWLRKVVELVVDVGVLPGQETTILDLASIKPVILREGAGDTSHLKA